ncbi:unnamed protein product [Pleuronectes platessa]|uniref:Uncharacterized protein n=1 Tax=Pleuronectes platessa TaxID=8262 RepID=A0A9N7TIW4_PLEPL|nr:unnamed protein product [Pleuronectes platessa]
MTEWGKMRGNGANENFGERREEESTEWGGGGDSSRSGGEKDKSCSEMLSCCDGTERRRKQGPESLSPPENSDVVFPWRHQGRSPSSSTYFREPRLSPKTLPRLRSPE